ncbi:MAG TPA: hypothetical protein VIS48_08405 [Candidatus Kryptonia bacterium]
MRNKVSTTLVLIILLSSLLASCSRFGHAGAFIQARPVTWTVLPDSVDPLFAYEFKCGNKSLKVRTVAGPSWGLVGIPAIPFFPFWAGTRSKFFYDIEVSTSDSVLLVEPPRVALRINDRSELIYPVEVFHAQSNLQKLPEEGLYHWDVRFPRRHEILATYFYKFPLNISSADSFDVAFPEEYQGCKVATIKYLYQSKFFYIPFYVPQD